MHLPFGIPGEKVSIPLFNFEFGAIIQSITVKILDMSCKVGYLYPVTVKTIKMETPKTNLTNRYDMCRRRKGGRCTKGTAGKLILNQTFIGL